MRPGLGARLAALAAAPAAAGADDAVEGVDAPETADAPGSWEAAVRDALRVVALSLWALNLPIAVVVLGGSIRGQEMLGTLGWVGVVLVLAGQALIPLTTRQRWQGGWGPGLAVAGLTAVGLILAVPPTLARDNLAGAVAGAPTWWPTQLLISVVLFLVVSHERWGWLLAIGLVGVNATLRVANWGLEEQVRLSALQVAAAQAGQLASMVAAAYLAVRVGLTAAQETDAARERERRARAQVGAAQARAAQAREADRLVHDEILHGLLAVASDPAPGGSDIAGTAARSALAVLERADPAHAESPAQALELADAVRLLARRQPLQVTVTGAARVLLPAEVTEAFVAAVGEALRNVVRHAGVDTAQVRIEQRLLATVVEVLDEGRGFHDPQAADRRGIADSIVRRMRDVGGTALVESSPGRGTRVTLRWTPPGVWQPEALGSGAAPRFLTRLPLILVPLLAALFWYAAWLGPAFPAPLPVLAATVIVVGAAGWVVRRGTTGGLDRRGCALVVVIAWVASAVNGLSLVPGLENGVFYWLSTGASVLGALLSFYRPVREVVICEVGLIVVAAASVARLTSDPRLALILLPAVLAPLLTMVAALGVRRLADRLGNEIVYADEAITRRLAMVEAAEALQERLHERLWQRAPQLAAFFREVLAAAPGTRSAELRRRAAELERAAREDLVLGDLVQLRACLIVVRDGGWRVTVRCAHGMAPDVEAAVVSALSALPVVSPSVVSPPAVSPPAESPPAESAAGPGATKSAVPIPPTVTVTAVPSGPAWRVSLLVDTHPGGSDAAGPPPSDPAAGPDWVAAWREQGWSVNRIEHTVHARRSLVVQNDDMPGMPGPVTMNGVKIGGQA